MLNQFTPFEHLYTQDRDQVIAEFQSTNKHLSDVEGEIEHYERIEEEIQLLPNALTVSQAILLSTGAYSYIHVHVCIVIHYFFNNSEPLKMAVAVEAKAWKTAYGRSLNKRYRSIMDRIVEFVSDYDKKLARPISVRLPAIINDS